MARHNIETEGDRPQDRDLEFFESKLGGHTEIKTWKRVGKSGQVFAITRARGDTIVVHVSDLYTIGEADYFFIRRRDPSVQCIVSISGYNSYTDDAKEQAVADEVGLFKFGEFLGALRLEKFWKYVSPAAKKAAAAKAAKKRGA